MSTFQTRTEKMVHLRFRAILLFLFIWTNTSAQYSVNFGAEAGPFNAYTLTYDSMWSRGAIWNTEQAVLDDPFDFTFEVYLGSKDGDGADGIVFAFQAVDANQGGAGQGMGIGGVEPSLFVELDTWQNPIEEDPEYDHLSIGRDGSVNHSDTNVNALSDPVPILLDSSNAEDGEWHSLRVAWSPITQNFDVYMDCNLRASYTGDIVNEIFGGDPNVYYGFTSATGGSSNLHQVRVPYEDNFPDTLPDARICNGGSHQVVIPAGTNWSWTTLDGDLSSINDPTLDQPLLTPTQTTTYIGTFDYNCETREDSLTVYVSDELNAQIHPTNTLFCEGDDGVVLTATPDQGVWKGQGVVDSVLGAWDPQIAGVGNHVVHYTVGQGECQSTDSMVMVVADKPIADPGENDTICLGNSRVLSATPGAGSYNWGADPTLSLTNGASTTASPLASQWYYLTVTDGNCSGVDSVHLHVESPPALQLAPYQAPCPGEELILSANGAASYVWESAGAVIGTDSTVTLVLNQSTDLVLTGANSVGCVTSLDLTVEVEPVATPIIEDSNTLFCEGDDGVVLTATPDQGVWKGQGVVDSVLGAWDPQIAGVGNHVVHYTVGQGKCQGADSIVMVVADKPIADPGENDTICLGNSRVLSATPGAGSYNWGADPTLSLTNGASTTASPLASQWYYLTVTDGNCSGVDSVHLHVESPPALQLAPYQAPCPGEELILSANGAASYVWESAGAVIGTDSTVTLVLNQSTDLVLTGTNQLGCATSLDLTVVVEPAATAVIDGPNQICPGDTVTLNASGGVQMNWLDPNGLISTDQGVLITAPDTSSSYFVEVVTERGCLDTAEFFVQMVNDLTMNISPLSGFCVGDTIDLIASGGSEVIWNFDPSLMSTVGSHVLAIAQDSGWYFANSTSGNCAAADSIFVAVTPRIDPVLTGENLICENSAPIQLISDVPDGWWEGPGVVDAIEGWFDPMEAATGKNEVVYKMEGSCAAENALIIEVVPSPEPTISAIGPICDFNTTVPLSANLAGGVWSGQGVHNEEATFDPLEVYDSNVVTVKYDLEINGCSGSDSSLVYLDPVSTELPSDTTVCTVLKQGVQLNSVSSSGEAYAWNTGETSPSIYASEAGVYRLTVTSAGGCTAVDSVQISSQCGCDVWLPSAFTPDGNGKNDHFGAVVTDERFDYTLSIYTRWGDLIWESNSVDYRWSGDYRGQPAKEDVYVVTGQCGLSEFAGRVSLVR